MVALDLGELGFSSVDPKASGRDGDHATAVLAAAGYNFGLLLRWFEAFSRALIAMILRPPPATQIA